jgi:Ca-activated chloride channel family protein
MSALARSCLVAVAVAATAAAQAPFFRGGLINIRSHSDLVLINASVTDSRGSPVTDLDVSRFHVFEDGKEQDIKSCSSEDAPISIGLLLDTSGSMGDKVNLMKEAAIRFVRAANPADEYFLIEFQSRPQPALSFTPDTDQLLEAIGRLQISGSTDLFDAVYTAVNEMRYAAYPRKALLIVSDGMNNHSRHTERETKRLVSEVDFPIYTIDLWRPQRDGNRWAIQRRDRGVLESLSAPTGGRNYDIRNPKRLAPITELISLEIRHQYVLGYAPTNKNSDGKYHKVRVKIDASPGERFTISNRAGYYFSDSLSR